MSPASTHSDPRTPPGAAAPGTGKAPSASLPAPHPGFVALLGIHLRSLVREFPVAWILFGGLAVGLPLASAFTVLDPSDAELTFGLTQLLSGLFAVQFCTVLVALWWPDAVWRNLPPGGRRVMDALPVNRRIHRLARTVAGFGLPLLMALSVLVTGWILMARLSAAELSLAQASRVILTGNAAVGLLAVGAAYLFGSALALRGWRVILLSLLLVVAYVFVPVGLLMGFGWDAVANRYVEIIVQGELSPVRVLLLGLRAEGGDLLSVLAWLVGLGLLCTHWAHRHDRA